MKNLILIALLGVALAGCGGEDDSKGPKAKSFNITTANGIIIHATIDSDANVTAKEYKLSIAGRFKK